MHGTHASAIAQIVGQSRARSDACASFGEWSWQHADVKRKPWSITIT